MKFDGIWANIFRLGRVKESVEDTLRQIPVFGALDNWELKTLASIVHPRTFEPLEVVFKEKEPGAGMYVILSGGVDIILNQDSGEPLYLAQLEEGDFFGEMALLGEGTRSATARARETTRLLGFFHNDLTDVMDLYPGMAAKIALGLSRTLADRLRFTNNQLRQVWEIRQ